MILTKDQVLHLLLTVGQVVQIALVLRQNLSNTVHEFVLLLEVERLEDEAQSDLRVATEELALNKLYQGLKHVREGLEDNGFHGEAAPFLREVCILIVLLI